MWFKNILLYEILEPFPVDTETLMDKLAQKAIRPTSKTEKETNGWVSPFGEASDVFTHSIGGCHLLKACKEVRLLPSPVIQEYLQKKLQEIEQSESRKVFRREKARLKEDIIFDLLPKAFTRRVYTYLYIDTKQRWIIVDSSSRATAEFLLQLLRDSIGSIKLAPPEFTKTPSRIMTDWLKHFELPSYLDIEDNCELKDLHNGDGIIKCQRQDLAATEIQNHLKSGKQVVKLGLTWRDRLAFSLEEDFAIKKIQCLDIINEARKDTQAETDAQKLDADFTLMMGEFKELITDLFGLLKNPADEITQDAKEEVEEFA
ncbi:MAG: recombination-associated protein RdgC [Gammaproteobacteria bacterium]|nr:recombination-associated protein RdgC [Gammaproteobacteria bacterium]